VGITTGVLTKAIINLSKAAKEMGLTMNLPKTKYMTVTKQPSYSKMLKMDDQEFQRAREFKLLGSTPTEQRRHGNKIENCNGKSS
jgi:hypothetical protein